MEGNTGVLAEENANLIVAKLLEILSGQLEWPVDASTGPTTSIGEDGLGLDSLMVVEFALDIEENFGFELDDDEMLEMGGMTLGEIAEFIDKRVAETAS